MILDEPTTGLDPNSRNQIITILSRLVSQTHSTIIMTTHFMDDAEECDEVVIVGNRKIIAQGPPAKLEKMLPGGGRVLSITLDIINDELLGKIEKIKGVEKVISEGRNLKILTEDVSLPKMTEELHKLGAIVTETKVTKATMMEVFVYNTGRKPE